MESAKEKLTHAKDYLSEKVGDIRDTIKDTTKAGVEKAEHMGEMIKEKTIGAKEHVATEAEKEKERLERMGKAAAHVTEEHKTRREL